MKVLLRRNVNKLGVIGEVVVVRDGYARNYLIPQGLATVPSEANLQAIEREKEAYLAELAREEAGLQARAQLLHGKEFTISARANEEGRLYGSVGPAQVAAAITADCMPVDPDDIVLDEPIHRLDKYEVPVRFAEEVEATIALWVVPTHDSDVPLEREEDQPEPSGASGDQVKARPEPDRTDE